MSFASGIGKLVYTSSPSVVFNGRDESGIDESVPYPARYLAVYPQTKAIAERLVIAANGSELSTVSLRPHLIWGPGDNHLFPRLVQRAREGKLRRVGNGKNLVDTTYVDNAANAHLQAANQLAPGSACRRQGVLHFQWRTHAAVEHDRPHVSLCRSAADQETNLCNNRVLDRDCSNWRTLSGRSDEPPMTPALLLDSFRRPIGSVWMPLDETSAMFPRCRLRMRVYGVLPRH